MRYCKLAILCFSLLIISSCENLLDDQPTSEINSENFYKTEGDALTAIYACYEYMGGGAFNENYGGLYFSNYWVIQALASDEGKNNQPIVDKERLSTFTHDPANSLLYLVWRDAYRIILAANAAAGNIPKISMDVDRRNALEGEARFIRALTYFELVRMFGDVPLILENVVGIDDARIIVRTPATQVYDQIIADLKFAAEHMQAEKITGQEGRATKYSASGILAKVYLTLGQWDNCTAELDKVIGSGNYSLWKDYSDAFLVANNNGDEVVFSINFANNLTYFWEAGQFNVRLLPTELQLNSNSWELPTDDLYKSFPAGDRRRDVTFITSYNKDGTLLTFAPHIQKYWDRKKEPNASSTGNDLALLRYSDILLMYAEALNEKSGPSPLAYERVNAVRKRARFHGDEGEDGTEYDVLKDLSGLTQNALRDSILMERKREFAFEGHRWFDLVRMNKLTGEVKKAKPESNVQEFHKLFPIPQREINTSSVPVPQNFGYEN